MAKDNKFSCRRCGNVLATYSDKYAEDFPESCSVWEDQLIEEHEKQCPAILGPLWSAWRKEAQTRWDKITGEIGWWQEAIPSFQQLCELFRTSIGGGYSEPELLAWWSVKYPRIQPDWVPTPPDWDWSCGSYVDEADWLAYASWFANGRIGKYIHPSHQSYGRRS